MTMQVLPKDTGWDTMAATMMKLYDAEIQNKAINLEQLNKQIAQERVLGNRSGLEALVQHPVEIKNQLMTEQPRTALDAMLNSGIDPSQLPRSLADIAAMKSSMAKGPGTVGALGATEKSMNAQSVSDLANSPDAVGAQSRFNK